LFFEENLLLVLLRLGLRLLLRSLGKSGLCVTPAVVLATDLVLLRNDGAGVTFGSDTTALVLHSNNLGLLLLLGTRRDVVLGRLVLEVTPDAIHDFLLGATDTKSVLLAKSVENFLGAVAKVVALLGARGIVKLLALPLGGGGLRGYVLDVLKQVTDATLDKLLKVLREIGVKVVLGDELGNALGHAGHFEGCKDFCYTLSGKPKLLFIFVFFLMKITA